MRTTRGRRWIFIRESFFDLLDAIGLLTPASQHRLCVQRMSRRPLTETDEEGAERGFSEDLGADRSAWYEGKSHGH